MDVGGKCSNCPRVVVLLRGANPAGWTIADLEQNGVKCVRVSSAYEAAAELLAAPTSALVIDLRAMAPRHGRLIAIAREMDVEMLAVGALPIGMSAEDLSGVRLLAGRDLPAALQRSVESAERAAPTTIEPTAEVEEWPQPEAETPRVRLTPARKPAGREVDRQPEPAQAASEGSSDAAIQSTEPADEAADVRADDDEPTYQATPPALGASNLLTPEELAALLENEQ